MATQIFKQFTRNFSLSSSRNFKVTLIGAPGGVGQPLALLLKQHPLIKTIVLHGIIQTKGVAADLSHVNTRAKVQFCEGESVVEDAVRGAHLIIVCAGFPRKEGMTRDDLLEKNATIIRGVATAMAKASPCAFLHVITNPVDSLVPMVCSMFKQMKKGNCDHVFGVTTLDLVRASTFAAKLTHKNPSKVYVPVVGGHSGDTIVPLFSQAKPKLNICDNDIPKLTKCVKEAGNAVVTAKEGKGSATLGIAFASFRAASNFLIGLKGKKTTETFYVRSKCAKTKFFSSPIVIGKNGVEKNLGVPKGLSCYEKKLLSNCEKILEKSIKKGEKLAQSCK